jgi:hypothetical protein
MLPRWLFSGTVKNCGDIKLTGVTVTDLSVHATTDGQLGAFAIAAAYAANQDPSPDAKPSPPGGLAGMKAAFSALYAKLKAKFTGASVNGQGAGENAKDTKGGSDGPKSAQGGGAAATPEFGVGASGSVAYNKIDLNTLASIEGATITKNSATWDGSVDVSAKRFTYITTVAGGAAFVGSKAKTSTKPILKNVSQTGEHGTLVCVESHLRFRARVTWKNILSKFQVLRCFQWKGA